MLLSISVFINVQSNAPILLPSSIKRNASGVSVSVHTNGAAVISNVKHNGPSALKRTQSTPRSRYY